MKRILLLLVVLAAGLSSSAQVTGAALNIRTQVKSYLAQEGYAPSIFTDGDLVFNRDGKKYYIAFENFSDRVYVTVSYYMDASDADANTLKLIANNVESDLKMIRIYVTNFGHTLVFQCDEFISSASDFKQMFSTYMDILDASIERVVDDYSNS